MFAPMEVLVVAVDIVCFFLDIIVGVLFFLSIVAFFGGNDGHFYGPIVW